MGVIGRNPQSARFFFLGVRYERGSLLVTSNRAVGEWGAPSSAIPWSPPRSSIACSTT